MQQIDLEQAKDKFSELMDQVANGEDVVILKDEQPFVKLTTAIQGTKRPRKFGSAKGMIQIADDFDEPLEDFKEYM